MGQNTSLTIAVYWLILETAGATYMKDMIIYQWHVNLPWKQKKITRQKKQNTKDLERQSQQGTERDTDDLEQTMIYYVDQLCCQI